MPSPTNQALVIKAPPRKKVKFSTVPSRGLAKKLCYFANPRSFSFSSSTPTSMHTLKSTGNCSIKCSFWILELTTVWVGWMYSWLIMTIWVEKATKQQMCVITQGLNSFCISDREFGSEWIAPTFMLDILAVIASLSDWIYFVETWGKPPHLFIIHSGYICWW